MTRETFFEKFDLFADAPDAVAKMRGLILRLAMQGKLSEPHKGDAPVTDLLRDVEKERAALGIKSAREAENGSSETEFFAIPSRWAWVQFGGLARHNAGKTLDKGRNRGELRDYITTSNLYWGFFQLEEVRQMPIEDEDLDRCTATKGDLLIVEGGEAGRAAVWCHDYDIAFQNHIHRARFFGGINPYFVQRYFETLNATGDIDKFRKGVGISNMSGKALASIPVPFPPLAEQKRIVAKVDELMVLCDRLEAQQQEREARHAAIARASLARFADAPTPANLNLLFHSSFPISPSDLRKSILTLAVQGKLVPQDPNDGSASQQFETIQARKADLVRKHVIKKSDPSRPIDPEELDHDIPDSWAWVRLSEICELITDGTHLTPKYTESGRMFLSAQNVKPFRFMPAKHRFVSEDHYQGYVKNRKPERGDVLLTRVGAGIGEAATIDQDLDFAIYVSLGLVRPVRGFVFSDYITLWLNSPDGTEKSSRNTYGKGVSQGNLNLSLIRNFLVPLPPLAEQRRIVAKVSELMALVDELETQLAASRAAAEKLLSALVAELTNN